MKFKIQLNNFLSLIGILLSFINNKYTYILISSIFGIIYINLERNNIQISLDKLQSIILGFTFGILFNYIFEIFIGLMCGYFLCNYNLTNNYILHNYDKFLDVIKNYSIKFENNYIVKDSKIE